MYEIDLSTAKTVFVTAGPYAHKWVTMDPADADAAIVGNWAVEEVPGFGPAVSAEELEAFQNREIDQASMDTWLAKINEDDQAEVEPARRTRKSKSSDT